MVQKADVEIRENPKTPEQEALEKLLESMEKPVQPPPIEDALAKAKSAMAKAAKVKQKVTETWYCTDCGAAHCQNDSPGLTGQDHIRVDVVDGEFTHPDGSPLAADEMELMTSYAAPKGGQNKATLAKMKRSQ